MNALRLSLIQILYVNRSFWRNPSRAFFTFAFPLMLLVIFTALLGEGYVHIGDLTVRLATYYVAAMAAYGVIMACYNNVAVSITFSRESGVLKRLDGSPLPKISFVASRVAHSTLIGVLLVVITAAFGRFFYHVSMPSGFMAFRFCVMLLVGAATFCALGLAVTAIIPNADATAAVGLGTILPACFLSGIFIPFGNNTPTWLVWTARVLPVRHFESGIFAGFVGSPFDWVDVAIVAAWGLFGLVLSVRFFRWLPTT